MKSQLDTGKFFGTDVDPGFTQHTPENLMASRESIMDFLNIIFVRIMHSLRNDMYSCMICFLEKV